jgi:putrescine transport system substrate-binding protein
VDKVHVRVGFLLFLTASVLVAACNRGGGAAPTGGSGTASPNEDGVLNVYNWADYIHPDTISNFEKEFGIRVNYDLFDASEVVEAKLLAGKTGYDVVLLATSFAERLIPIGVFQPLDKSKLQLWDNFDPWVLQSMAAYDPGNRFAIPYMWGSTGFAYNVDMVRERMPDAPLDSADMMFDVEVVSRLADCGVTWLDSPTDLVPLAMLYLGYDANSLEAGELAEVEALLK